MGSFEDRINQSPQDDRNDYNKHTEATKSGENQAKIVTTMISAQNKAGQNPTGNDD